VGARVGHALGRHERHLAQQVEQPAQRAGGRGGHLAAHGRQGPRVRDHRCDLVVGHVRVLVRRHEEQRPPVAPHSVPHGALPIGVREAGRAAGAGEVGAGDATDERIVEDDVPAEVRAVAVGAAAGQGEAPARGHRRRAAGHGEGVRGHREAGAHAPLGQGVDGGHDHQREGSQDGHDARGQDGHASGRGGVTSTRVVARAVGSTASVCGAWAREDGWGRAGPRGSSTVRVAARRGLNERVASARGVADCRTAMRAPIAPPTRSWKRARTRAGSGARTAGDARTVGVHALPRGSANDVVLDPAPGEYLVACVIGGHHTAGMVRRLTVSSRAVAQER
jgi:hypothetical protein